MNTAQILRDVENLDHDQRWDYMIALGKKSIIDSTLSKLLNQLASSPIHYERLLVFMSVHGSFNEEIIAKLLEDPSCLYSFSLIKLAAKHLDDNKLLMLTPHLSESRRYGVFQALLKEGRTTLTDRLYEHAEIKEQLKLLPFVSEALIHSYLSTHSIEELEIASLGRLTQRFPALVNRFLQESLNKIGEPSWIIKNAVETTLQKMYQLAPKTGLSLITKIASRITPQAYLLNRYVQRFPEEIAALTLDHPSLTVTFPTNSLRRLTPLTLCKLVKAGALNLTYQFSKLNPEQRATLYQHCGESWRNQEGALPLQHTKALAKATREAEAQHAFNLPLLASSPLQRVPYLAALSFSNALPLAEPFLSQPEGDLRAQAVAALVETGRYYSTELNAILDFCIKREHEQDPVRLAMMQALADLPPSRWQAEHLPKLQAIISAVLKARDCSYQTMSSAANLLLGMIVQQTDFTITELPNIVERMGSLYSTQLESRMTDNEMQQLAPRLLPLLNTWIAHDKSQLALELIYCFGCRAKAVPPFAKLMVGLTNDKRSHVAHAGLQGLFRLQSIYEATQLIPKLIQQDPSWIRADEVARHLHRYQQSLLTPFLETRVYKGRFSSGGTAILANFDQGFARWTCNQQSIYAESLQTIINNPKRNAWELYQSVYKLGEMPSIDLAPLVKLAGLKTKDAALRDKAIEALGRADAGRGIPTLLEALDDARARIAIYALRRSLINMPSRQALALLAEVPRNKVTVAKEVIHLIGEFECKESYELLNSFAANKDLHPDVQIALLRAYWSYLNHDEVWPRFHAAAKSPRAALARSTIRIPQEGLSTKAREALSSQLTLLLQHPDAQVRKETLERLVFMPLSEKNTSLRSELIKHLEDIDKGIVQLAAEALLAAYAHQQNDLELVTTFAKVTRAKAIVAIVTAYEKRKRVTPQGLEWSAQALANLLIAKRWQVDQAARLAITLLTPSNGLMLLQTIEQASLLHPGVVEICQTKYKQIVKGQQQQFEAVESDLRHSNHVCMRRIGLSLLIALTNQYGWTENYSLSLADYCKDKELWISDAAELIEPPVALA